MTIKETIDSRTDWVTMPDESGNIDSMAGRESDLMGIVREQLEARTDVIDTESLLGVILLNRLTRCYASWVQTTARALGVDENETAILVALRLRDPEGATAASLKETLLITSGGVTRATDRLVGKGLAKRYPDPGDGRRVRTRLTTTGRRRADGLLSLFSRSHADRMAQLGPARQREILAALDDLLDLYNDVEVPR